MTFGNNISSLKAMGIVRLNGNENEMETYIILGYGDKLLASALLINRLAASTPVTVFMEGKKMEELASQTDVLAIRALLKPELRNHVRFLGSGEDTIATPDRYKELRNEVDKGVEVEKRLADEDLYLRGVCNKAIKLLESLTGSGARIWIESAPLNDPDNQPDRQENLPVRDLLISAETFIRNISCKIRLLEEERRKVWETCRSAIQKSCEVKEMKTHDRFKEFPHEVNQWFEVENPLAKEQASLLNMQSRMTEPLQSLESSGLGIWIEFPPALLNNPDNQPNAQENPPVTDSILPLETFIKNIDCRIRLFQDEYSKIRGDRKLALQKICSPEIAGEESKRREGREINQIKTLAKIRKMRIKGEFTGKAVFVWPGDYNYGYLAGYCKCRQGENVMQQDHSGKSTLFPPGEELKNHKIEIHDTSNQRYNALIQSLIKEF